MTEQQLVIDSLSFFRVSKNVTEYGIYWISPLLSTKYPFSILNKNSKQAIETSLKILILLRSD